MKAYTVAVGNIDPKNKNSRKAVKYVATLHGFIGVHPNYPHGTLILFDTENNAKIARNLMNAKGIVTGRNICEVEIDDIYAKGNKNENRS